MLWGIFNSNYTGIVKSACMLCVCACVAVKVGGVGRWMSRLASGITMA